MKTRQGCEKALFLIFHLFLVIANEILENALSKP